MEKTVQRLLSDEQSDAEVANIIEVLKTRKLCTGDAYIVLLHALGHILFRYPTTFKNPDDVLAITANFLKEMKENAVS